MTCCTGDRPSRRAFLTALMGAVTSACASTFTAILTYPEFAAVPAALLAGGFTEEDSRKLLGVNAVRVVESALDGA